jgi:hypothetical protein
MRIARQLRARDRQGKMNEANGRNPAAIDAAKAWQQKEESMKKAAAT